MDTRLSRDWKRSVFNRGCARQVMARGSESIPRVNAKLHEFFDGWLLASLVCLTVPKTRNRPASIQIRLLCPYVQDRRTINSSFEESGRERIWILQDHEENEFDDPLRQRRPIFLRPGLSSILCGERTAPAQDRGRTFVA